MAKKKAGKSKVPATIEEKATGQARIELPVEDIEWVRGVARSLGLSLSAFIRMAVLTTARRMEDKGE